MAMDKVDKLYQNYDILANPANKPSEHEAEFLEIIESAKGSSSEKIMASQFIPRFFKDFPNLVETAVDAQLDMMEDADMSVRKHAIKYLPSFCKDTKEYVPKIADALTQMLQSEDANELSTVQAALMTILKLDIKKTLEGIFAQITTTEDAVIRKRAIQFLCTKFKFLPPDVANKEVEEFVLEKCKTAFPEIGGEDFLTLFPLLSNMKIAKTVATQQVLVTMISEQAELENEFEPTPDDVAGFLQCVKLAMPYFSTYIPSTPFVAYICLSMLPKLAEIEQLEGGKALSLDVVQILAEISNHIAADDQVQDCCEVVYKILLEYIPHPPASDENMGDVEEPNLQFTHIECLMYNFTHLLKCNPEFLTSAEHAARFKDLKTRLQYLARGVQNGIKIFRESLVAAKTTDTKAEETKTKALAVRTFNNINALIRDLFRTPPTFKTAVALSWKPLSTTSKTPVTVGNKRALDTSDDSHKMQRKDQRGWELYIPPSGKYSTNVNAYSAPQRGGYYSRGRGRRF